MLSKLPYALEETCTKYEIWSFLKNYDVKAINGKNYKQKNSKKVLTYSQ